jgi:AcrR family transcriptional regulator
MRRTQRDWLQAGIELLAGEGRHALKVDRLSRRLGVTKGSFYHHFRDLAEYRTQLLAFYREAGTLRIIDAVDREPGPRARLERLLEIVVEFAAAPEKDAETALRAWALDDAEVAAVQRDVDGRRIDYVAGLLREQGAEPARARVLAELLYALIVGAEQMQPPADGVRMRAWTDEYLRLIDHHLNPEAP